MDGLDENGVPDPTITAFNAPSTFVVSADEEDQDFIRELLAELGVPDIVLTMVDERGVEILLQLVVLEGAERDAYIAGLGFEVACSALLGNFQVDLPEVPLYTLGAQGCAVADLNAPATGSYFSDLACTNEVAFSPTDDDFAYCEAQFGAGAENTLGDATRWIPDTNQPGDELPNVPSRAWTTVPTTELDLGTVSLVGNNQPYMKQLKYKTITGTGRGTGTCELEMRVYKRDVTEQGLRPLLAFHGGTWQNRRYSFRGLEAGSSQFTERGFIVFAPFFRLVGEKGGNIECNGTSWHEVTEDVESALAWVRQNGAALGAADMPVSVFGQSAGAHLSQWLAANAPDDVDKALLYYGPTDALEFLQGAVPLGGPNESYRSFGLQSLERFFGSQQSTAEMDLAQIDYAGLTVEQLNTEWASIIPAAVFDLTQIDPLLPPAYVARCAAITATDLTAINLAMPPAALLDCMKQDLSDFLIANSFMHQLDDEAVPVFVLHGSGDTVVPHTQAVNLCGAIDGSVFSPDVFDPLTIYQCGVQSEAHIIRDAEHTPDLGFCVEPLCPAGPSGSETRSAAAAAINSSYAWLQETASPPIVPTFADVPTDYWAFTYIEAIAAAGITGGCGGGNYCPDSLINRAQMAIFLERAMRGGSYTPPPATGTVFSDVPATHFAAAFIEQLKADGITGGCGGGKYCPSSQVSRAHMAIFLLRAKHGSGYSPPPATGQFADVPTSHWAARWIEQFAAEGISSGCGGGNFCPTDSINRAQMAVFLARAFEL